MVFKGEGHPETMGGTAHNGEGKAFRTLCILTSGVETSSTDRRRSGVKRTLGRSLSPSDLTDNHYYTCSLAQFQAVRQGFLTSKRLDKEVTNANQVEVEMSFEPKADFLKLKKWVSPCHKHTLGC